MANKQRISPDRTRPDVARPNAAPPGFFRFRVPILAILLLLLAGGFMAYRNIQVSLFPEKTFPKIKVIANAGDQPVELMMVAITQPLENAVNQVEGVQTVRSVTSRGSCELSIYLDWNVDINVSLQRVNAYISQIQNTLLPNTSIAVQRMNPSILPVMDFALESTGRDLIELRKLALYTIRPFLSQVPGVSNVQIMGGRTKEYWIVLRADKLATLNVTPAAITTALANTNFVQADGLASDYHRLYLTLTDATVHSKQDVENIVIRSNGQRVLRLADVATVELHEQQEFTRIEANGKQTVLVNVVKQPTANLVKLSADIAQKVRDLKNVLPAGITLTPTYVQADFVSTAVKSVTDSILIGLALAIIVTSLFLRSLRASAVILLIIPVVLATTMLVLYAIGFTLDIMTLGGIAAAIGLIIDDAVVIVEQIHSVEEEHDGESTPQTIQQAISYLFPAMIGSSLSTIVIFLPFALMSGVAGAFFKVLATTMVITLVCSFLITWLGLPVVYGLFSFLKKKKGESTPGSSETHPSIGKWLSVFIHHPVLALVLSGAMGVAVYLIYSRLETGFLPEMDEGAIVLDYFSPPGTSLDETNVMLTQVDKQIRTIPEVQAFTRRTGAQMGFFITEPNRGDYLIALKKDRSRSTSEVIDELRGKIEATQPALNVDFGQVLGDMLGDLMSTPSPVEVKVFGNDPAKLRPIAQKVSDVVTKVQGTADVFDGVVIAGPSVVFRPIPDALLNYGLTPMDLQNQLLTKLQGNEVGNILEGNQFVKMRLKYPDAGSNLTALRQSPIFTADGRSRLLSDFTAVSVDSGSAEIERENLQPMIPVTARLSNRDLGSVIRDIQQQVGSQVSLAAGQHIEYGGAYAQQQQSFRELLMILISASLLVFVVLLFLFRDLKAAGLILFISVLGVSGSFIALFVTKTPLNVGSYTGIIMIVGIIAENAIFTFQQFASHHKTAPVAESIEFAISARIRPKLMTATSAIMALSPLALGIGRGAELHQPLAIAVIGGFFAALPLLLLIFPGLLRLAYKDESTQTQ
ncbi:efflux RND transporter permease subunit [Spirosoma spitsbergense]|uniref:efflux RND transporter permease subunit n=1 Tax=Spirosoma spitsbergense TaxID=431554 RepID=UPI0003630F6F|nr:efflux RND transporter permease subunit [Spirosoma spitsbergense]